MKRIRVWVQAEYEFPDEAELVQIVGEPAIRLGDHVVKPTLDFVQLQEATDKFSVWVEAEEEVYDSVLASERRLTLDLLHSDGAT